MRPFTWPHVVVPLLPAGLIEVLDAPVPILIGLPQFPSIQPQKYPDLIWVLPDSSGRGSRIVCGNKEVLGNVKEPEGKGVRGKLRSLFAALGEPSNGLSSDPEKMSTIYAIADVFKDYFDSIVAVVPATLHRQTGGLLDVDRLQQAILSQTSKSDMAFMSAFTSTQVFLIHIEERIKVQLHSQLFL